MAAVQPKRAPAAARPPRARVLPELGPLRFQRSRTGPSAVRLGQPQGARIARPPPANPGQVQQVWPSANPSRGWNADNRRRSASGLEIRSAQPRKGAGEVRMRLLAVERAATQPIPDRAGLTCRAIRSPPPAPGKSARKLPNGRFFYDPSFLASIRASDQGAKAHRPEWRMYGACRRFRFCRRFSLCHPLGDPPWARTNWPRAVACHPNRPARSGASNKTGLSGARQPIGCCQSPHNRPTSHWPGPQARHVWHGRHGRHDRHYDRRPGQRGARGSWMVVRRALGAGPTL